MVGNYVLKKIIGYLRYVDTIYILKILYRCNASMDLKKT